MKRRLVRNDISQQPKAQAEYQASIFYQLYTVHYLYDTVFVSEFKQSINDSSDSHSFSTPADGIVF